MQFLYYSRVKSFKGNNLMLFFLLLGIKGAAIILL